MEKPENWFEKPILNFKEACIYCGRSESRMYKHTHFKEVPHFKPTGKLIYFLREDLDKWLLQNRVATRDELEREAVKLSLT